MTLLNKKFLISTENKPREMSAVIVAGQSEDTLNDGFGYSYGYRAGEYGSIKTDETIDGKNYLVEVYEIDDKANDNMRVSFGPNKDSAKQKVNVGESVLLRMKGEERVMVRGADNVYSADKQIYMSYGELVSLSPM